MNILQFQALHLLALQACKKVDTNSIRELARSGQYQQVFDFDSLKNFVEVSGHYNLYPEEKYWNEAINIFDRSMSLGILVVAASDPLYPKYLKAIDDYPPVIHLRGDISCMKYLPGISVVGTRKITDNGRIIAYRIANFLANHNYVIVSGLALGVDAIAHRAALDSNKPHSTIAVLAHGLEHAKPSTNKKLADEILANGGLWVSEHPIGTPPKPDQFVARNRIQLGLSVGSVIIEADLKSGSVTQAKFCVKQKRPLFAVVPQYESNPLNLLSAGTQMMVKELGAVPIKSREDYPLMLERFGLQFKLMNELL